MSTALLFANGDLNDGPAVRTALGLPGQRLIIAVDGGLKHVTDLGLVPDVLIGDLDSVTPEQVAAARDHGTQIVQYPAHKDETDLELGLMLAAQRDCRTIRVVGGLGDRLDQSLGNVYLLGLSLLHDRDVKMVAGKQTTWLAYPGETVIHGTAGDTVSLIPLSADVSNISTAALEYPLRGETLRFGPARGVSNVMLGTDAQVRFENGLLLIVHTLGRA